MATIEVAPGISIVTSRNVGLALYIGQDKVFMGVDEIPAIFAKLQEAAREMGVELPGDAELAAAQASAAELRDAIEGMK